MLGLNRPSSGSTQKCPYGDPPAIFVESESSWSINGVERQKADQKCQIILVDPKACATCPLNPRLGAEQEKAPSEVIQHLLMLDEYMQAGVVFGFDALTRMEWRALALLKHKRNQAEIKKLDDERQLRNSPPRPQP